MSGSGAAAALGTGRFPILTPQAVENAAGKVASQALELFRNIGTRFQAGLQAEGKQNETIVKGMPFSDGVYKGQWNPILGCPEGSGHIVYQNGTVYEGMWHNGKPHGYGQERYKNGIRVWGMMQEGRLFGEGRVDFPGEDSRELYMGSFKDGRPHGRGIVEYKNGDADLGEYINGEFSLGKRVYADKSTIEGHWKDGKPTGVVFGTHVTGLWCMGPVEKGQFNGQVRVIYRDGATYVGGMKKSLRHGHGTYTCCDGNKLEGLFQGNVFRGSQEASPAKKQRR